MSAPAAPDVAPSPAGPKRDRLLPWIAAERGFRAIVLVAIGLILITHPHTDWARTITRFTKDMGMDPSDNGIQRIIAKVHNISPSRLTFYGAVAIAYGALEATEAYGLWHQRRWGEYLTVFATSILLVPEVWEIVKGPTLLKVGALVVNVAIVAYLVVRLRRASAARAAPGGAAPG